MTILFEDVPEKIRSGFGSLEIIDSIARLQDGLGWNKENRNAIADLLYSLEIKEIPPQEIKPRLGKLGLTEEQLSLALTGIQKILLPIKQDLLDYGINIDLITADEKTVRAILSQITKEAPAGTEREYAPTPTPVSPAPAQTKSQSYAPLRPSFSPPESNQTLPENSPRVVNYSETLTPISRENPSMGIPAKNDLPLPEIHSNNVIDLKDLPK